MKRWTVLIVLLLTAALILPACGGTPQEATTAPAQSTNLTVHFIDVGQADAALVQCDGHFMLIDGGNAEDSSRIYTVLKNAGVEKLDLVVGTHAHEDHIGGLSGAFHYTTADVTLCPVTDYDSKAFRNFRDLAQEKGGGITVPKVGDTYALGGAKVQILGVNATDDTNDSSILLRIDHGEVSFLFAADGERPAEQAVLDSGLPLRATVLKVGHHGSDSSTSYPFLREVMPAYGVISVGTDNTYGHPTEEVLSRLEDAGVQVMRTDLQGDIRCESDGKTVTFTTDRNQEVTTHPEEDTGETWVWITEKGTKFHSNSQCSDMVSPWKVTEEAAREQGREPCKKCW